MAIVKEEVHLFADAGVSEDTVEALVEVITSTIGDHNARNIYVDHSDEAGQEIRITHSVREGGLVYDGEIAGDLSNGDSLSRWMLVARDFQLSRLRLIAQSALSAEWTECRQRELIEIIADLPT